MAMREIPSGVQQPEIWDPATKLPCRFRHSFYDRLNRVSDQLGFESSRTDRALEFIPNGLDGRACDRVDTLGCCGWTTSKVFDTEQVTACRVTDSIRFGAFLEYDPEKVPPDHSIWSWPQTRRLIDMEMYRPVFTSVLERLVEAKFVVRHTLGIDATTFEANTAICSVLR